MKYKLAIFDLDGTILNTIEDLADSLNYALATADLPLRTLEQVRGFVGNGIRKLIERGCPEGSSLTIINRVHHIFMQHYNIHCMDKTSPYEGITDVLTKLNNEGVICAVLSNKADAAVQLLIRDFFPDRFRIVAGERETQGIKKKPAPDGIYMMLAELGIDKKDAVYIGDSEVDIETARNAGVDCIEVLWGYRDEALLKGLGQETFAHTAEELYRLLS